LVASYQRTTVKALHAEGEATLAKKVLALTAAENWSTASL
jgi:hypothetical protein